MKKKAATQQLPQPSEAIVEVHPEEQVAVPSAAAVEVVVTILLTTPLVNSTAKNSLLLTHKSIRLRNKMNQQTIQQQLLQKEEVVNEKSSL